MSTAPVSGGACATNGTTTSFVSNHGHTNPVISASNVSSGTQITVGVGSGSAGHSHTVTITAANFTTLQGNQGISITTNADGTGHTHSIIVNCA